MTDEQALLPADKGEVSEIVSELRSHSDAKGKRGMKLLLEMIDVVADALRREVSKTDSSEAQAIVAVYAIAHCFGGRMAYLPAGRKLHCALRDREIWKEHDKKPTHDTVLHLAGKHRLGEMRIYQIINEQRALRTNPMQSER